MILRSAMHPDLGTPARLGPLSELLIAWNSGDASALDQLIPLVHAELRRVARRQMRNERPGHTLQPTALVNEVYMRLAELRQMRWQNRAQFFAIAARLMRQVLVDIARARNCHKRGGDARRITLDIAVAHAVEPRLDVVALNDALEALGRQDARKAQVIELRFFGGLSVEETARALQVSNDTVQRDWKLAKAWLLRELQRSQ
jgi:RNA polymerase sigma factor (TIGR02999 family)